MVVIVIFHVLQVSVLEAFENLEKIVKQHYSTEDQLIISCPTQDEVSLLLDRYLGMPMIIINE